MTVMRIDHWMKAFLIMGTVMLVRSCTTLTKTVHDNLEAEKRLNRIEDAKIERLLVDVSKVARVEQQSFIAARRRLDRPLTRTGQLSPA